MGFPVLARGRAAPRSGVRLVGSDALASSRPPPTLRAVRELVTEPDLLEALTGCVAARQIEATALAAAYERVLTIQMETIERRAASGLSIGLVSLDAIAEPDQAGGPRRGGTARDRDGLCRGAAPGSPERARRDGPASRCRSRQGAGPDPGAAGPRPWTGAAPSRRRSRRPGRWRSCSTDYGLSLSEVELKEQSCEGFGVGTGRRRFGPIDSCIPAVGEFCDCRVWSEKTADGEIRYVFFGLPADVAGARYLYELVEQAFATETELFKRSELYDEHRSGDRRSATQSFQTGLAHGIASKLDELRRQREETMRTATGRDLVPVKEAVVEEELAKLGLRFQTRGGGQGRYVLRDAYEAGHEAGDRFEYRPGITGASGVEGE